MSFQKDSKNRFVSDGPLSLNQTKSNNKQSPKLSFSESSISTWTQQQHIYSPRFKYILYLFILVLLFDILSPFTTDIYDGILPIIINEDNLNSTPFMIQLSLILFTLLHSLSQIVFISLINDCFNLQYGYVLVIGLVIYCSSSIMCALSSTIQIFIISRAFQGFGSGFAVIVQNQLSCSLYPSLKLYLTNFVNSFSIKSKLHSYRRNIKTNRENTPYGAKDHHAYSSILTNSDGTNTKNSIIKYNNKRIKFLLFLVASIRAIIGIASAAPIGSIITYYSCWQNIFLFLCCVGIITAVFILPLFTKKLFQMEISQENNGLLGIKPLSISISEHHSHDHHSEHNNSEYQHNNSEYQHNNINNITNIIAIDNPSEMNKNKIIITSPKSVESPNHNILLKHPQQQFIHLQPNNNTKFVLINKEKENMNENISTLSLSDEITTMSHLTHITALSVIQSQQHASINEDKTFMQQFRIFSIYFLFKKPLSLLLLILFSCGYIGILLILCEISFIFDHKIINTGLLIGCMVLCLIIASGISANVMSKHISKNISSQWILSTIICIIFGIFSLISMIPIAKYKFNIQLFQKVNTQFIENDKIITNQWIYICVFLYIFLFGWFVPPLMSLLYYSFIECSISLNYISLIIHFWRNIFACIVVIIILGFRQTIENQHSNFLHLCITLCCFAIFIVYFIFTIPLKFILDKRQHSNTLRSNIGSSFNDIFSKNDVNTANHQSNDQTASPILFNRHDIIQDGKHQIDLYDGDDDDDV